MLPSTSSPTNTCFRNRVANRHAIDNAPSFAPTRNNHVPVLTPVVELGGIAHAQSRPSCPASTAPSFSSSLLHIPAQNMYAPFITVVSTTIPRCDGSLPGKNSRCTDIALMVFCLNHAALRSITDSSVFLPTCQTGYIQRLNPLPAFFSPNLLFPASILSPELLLFSSLL